MRFFYHVGKYVFMLKSMFGKPESFNMYWHETLRQMNNIGVGSIVIVGIISFFVGAVTCLQFSFQIKTSFIPVYLIGYIVRDTMLIELSATLSALVLAGKVGSNMASELGTMRITEQIDALEIMGINSVSYLVGPKILAAILIVPPIVILSAFLGMYGGWLAAINYDIPGSLYEKGLTYRFVPFNLVIMQIKSVVFAFILTSVACYQGFYVKGGALEIGKASTRAVVVGSILIILFDYIIALLLT